MGEGLIHVQNWAIALAAFVTSGALVLGILMGAFARKRPVAPPSAERPNA